MQKILYPQQDFKRGEWLNLNGPWNFSLNTAAYDRVIEVPYPWGSPLSGIDAPEAEEYKPLELPEGAAGIPEGCGAGYYKKVVVWNPENARVFLHFGAVDYISVVRVNGKKVAEHRGGYARFSAEVTGLWNRDGENTIEVDAYDPGNRGDNTYGKQGYGDAKGIWQTVWLEACPKAYIKSFFVKTELEGRVTYEVETVDATDGMKLIADFEGNTAEAFVKDNKAVLELNVKDPEWWTPENPRLYEGKLTLGADEVETYFGIREIGSGVFGEHGKRYITLNRKPYFINGTLDQSFNPQGFFTLPSDDDCREEILRLKRIGVNMARIHIKAEEPLKLYWADRLGLLVMADFPCFWGEPLPETRVQYEAEFEQQVIRDRNHPSIFAWVVFNETWGLFMNETLEDGSRKKVYTEETAQWVVDCWKKVKEMDPNRLVEDNSACNADHTVTDINTWHFYSNGYKVVKGVVDRFTDGAWVGSSANYKEGYTMGDVPCMNSECGNVWGIDGSAGESDISWQYRYMINEFRLHDTLCGFIFTEFHDVVNEFNGYYKLNNGDKDFGYEEYGLSLRDLHSQDYLGADFAPMATVKPGDEVRLPMFGSSFTDIRHGKQLTALWTLRVTDPEYGNYIADGGEFTVDWKGYGTFDAGEIVCIVPDADATALLSWTLLDEDEPVMTQGILLDIRGERTDCLAVAPSELTGEGFERCFTAQNGRKINGLGAGSFSVTIDTDKVPGLRDAADLEILLEASTRCPMTHDYPDGTAGEKVDADYMLGYRCDPGANRNSFVQTDADKYPGTLTILVDGEKAASVYLEDCPADSRGALSHHYQENDRLLDEAGTYGTLVKVRVPSAILMKIARKDSFTLTLKTDDTTGLSVFGRESGRYAADILLRAVK